MPSSNHALSVGWQQTSRKRSRKASQSPITTIGLVALLLLIQLSCGEAFSPALTSVRPCQGFPCSYSSQRTRLPDHSLVSRTRSSNLSVSQGVKHDDEMEGFWSRDNSELLSFEADWREILDPAIEPGEGDDFHLTARDLGVVVLITTGISALMATMIIMSGTGAWRYYFAGGACAAVSHTIPVPVDVVKTRKQVDADYVDCSFPDALRKLVQAEGPTSLFVGLGPTFWGYCIEGSVKFGVYEILKPLMATVIPYRLLNFAACGAVSGFAASIMLCPMEALRIRLVAEREYAERGWIQGGLWMIRREGASGFARGIWPMIYKQVPYTITKNVSFDLITTALYRRWSSTVGWVVPLTAAVVASVLSCLASQPGDMLLSLVNAHEGERRDTMDLARVLWRLKGWRGFFVGLKTRLLHVGMIVTMQLLIYDFVKRSFGIAATGSI